VRASGGNQGARAWLDWVEAVVERQPAGGPDRYLAFPTPGGVSGRVETVLSGFPAEPRVWDVTDAGSIRSLGVAQSGSGWRVQVDGVDGDNPSEIVAFDPAGPAVRAPGGRGAGAVDVPNQNLHGVAGFPDYIVVTHEDFLSEAQRLADYRRQRDGLSPLVVTIEQVQNEFAGGTEDMRAVRDLLKFLYDRAPSDQLPGYLLMVGDGHYDFRNIRTGVENYVPTYQSQIMLTRDTSFMSDDYFGLLGDDEGIWGLTSRSDRVDLAIGRIPARSVSDVRNVVSKIIRYEDPATQGEWRTRFTFVADDQYPNDWDNDVHVLNSDVAADLAQDVDPTVTLQKIYGPSYPDVVTARGRLRPQANEAIRESIERGTLIWSYSGHGGPSGLGDEEYITEELVSSLDNADQLPVWVTATCSFGKFDITETQSLAERILMRSGGGGVAMLTTVRLVFTGTNPGSGDNFGLNLTLTEELLQRDASGRPSRIGDALWRTKNTVIGASFNNRKFNLLGDPAMRLGLPQRPVDLTVPSTLRAFEEATVSGQVLGLSGQPDPTFNGTVQIEVYDAARKVTLPEGACCNTDSDDEDRLGDYTDRSGRIYAGRASVSGGQFATTFLVPQDVSYSGLPARVVVYVQGEDGSDGVGQSVDLVVATDAGTRPNDSEGPEVSLFVNDSTFVDGGTTSLDGMLIAQLRDASGINTVGAGVGHELLLVVDGDQANAIDVGRFYQGDLNTYRSGTVRVPLAALSVNDRPLAP
ncbi:MAG: type IX secretion system sortase PorU, partial [Bacteroidota bacterium]